MLRCFASVDDDVQLIAGEVLKYGTSSKWDVNTHDELNVAIAVEKRLARFNIGYNGKSHNWEYRHNGTRHFNSHKLLTVAKQKLTGFIASFKK